MRIDDQQTTQVPSALRAGRLEGISFPDLLWALCRQRTSGVLRVAGGGAERALYLERGRIVFASSSDPDDRLGELFLRQGRIDLVQLEEAVARLRTGKRLGTLLVESGALSADQLVRGVLSQVEGIVLGMFELEGGDYRFEEGPLPTEEVIKLGMRTGELLLRGIRQIRSFGRIRRSVGGAMKVYGLADGWRGLADGLDLGEGEHALLERLRRSEASIDALCRELFLSNFEIYQALWGFRVIGLIEEREPRGAVANEADCRGTLGEEGFAALLVRLGRAGETGVLYVNRGSQERTFHISTGRCVFATSNDPDDGLVAYLLRRGVISLSDREETAKRLLSNKRVGTILRELGVIDDRDLREMVRQQLSEIVFDTFRWADAEYAFVRGSLPTVEEITLDQTIDAIVAAGLRRVDSWSRVWRGCGGLEVRLSLRPTYLAVLDAMGAGAEEWQVITALKTPASARQLCRASDLEDFRLCQIVWTLRVLGAVGDATPAELEASQNAAATTAPLPPVSVPSIDPPVLAESPWEDLTLDEPTPAPRLEAPESPARPIDPPVLAESPWEDLTLDEPAPAARRETPEPPAPPSDEIQILPRHAFEAALRVSDGVQATSPPPLDATQAISVEVLAAAQNAPDSHDDTGPISRDEIAASHGDDEAPQRPAELHHAPEESVDTAATEHEGDWAGPADLEASIEQFNHLHRLVYRAVRSEVGAGAPNFIRSCLAQLAGPAGVVEGVPLQTDGSWEVEALRLAVQRRRVEDPRTAYSALLEQEVEQVRQFLGDVRARELRQQMEKAAQAAVGD